MIVWMCYSFNCLSPERRRLVSQCSQLRSLHLGRLKLEANCRQMISDTPGLLTVAVLFPWHPPEWTECFLAWCRKLNFDEILFLFCSRAKNVVAAARPPVRFFSPEAPVVDLYLGQLDQVRLKDTHTWCKTFCHGVTAVSLIYRYFKIGMLNYKCPWW